MAFTRGRIVWKHAEGSTDRAKELFAGVLLGTLIATLGLHGVLSSDALAPAIATLLFTSGAATAGFALLCPRNQARTVSLGITCFPTFVAVSGSTLLAPHPTGPLSTLSDRSVIPYLHSAILT